MPRCTSWGAFWESRNDGAAPPPGLVLLAADRRTRRSRICGWAGARRRAPGVSRARSARDGHIHLSVGRGGRHAAAGRRLVSRRPRRARRGGGGCGGGPGLSLVAQGASAGILTRLTRGVAGAGPPARRTHPFLFAGPLLRRPNGVP